MRIASVDVLENSTPTNPTNNTQVVGWKGYKICSNINEFFLGNDKRTKLTMISIATVTIALGVGGIVLSNCEGPTKIARDVMLTSFYGALGIELTFALGYTFYGLYKGDLSCIPRENEVSHQYFMV